MVALMINRIKFLAAVFTIGGLWLSALVLIGLVHFNLYRIENIGGKLWVGIALALFIIIASVKTKMVWGYAKSLSLPVQ